MKFKIKFKKFSHFIGKEIKTKKREKTNDRTRKSTYKYQQLF